MTTTEAITALLDEFHLDEFVDLIRDEARYDANYQGLSQEHPRVKRFKECVAALRQATRSDP